MKRKKCGTLGTLVEVDQLRNYCTWYELLVEMLECDMV